MLYAVFELSVRLTRRPDFRIVELSIQGNHVHLIAEAESNDALARGIKSFAVRTNRRFNAALGRPRGGLWADRYHREDLTTPRQVRNALVYCLNNAFCSAARWFEGWNAKRTDAESDGSRPTPSATLPLLTHLWQKRHGLIDPRESPKARAA